MSLAERIRRRWRWGAGACLLVFVPLAIRVASLPDVHQSTAVVLIERQQIPDELVKSTVTSTLEVRLQTISQQILSRSGLERTIAQFGLYQDLKNKTPMERVIEQMREEVKIELTRGQGEGATPMGFTVRYQGRDPHKVALVANSLASSFIEENLKLRERQAKGTADFLGGLLEVVEQELRSQEKQLALLKPRRDGEPPGQAEANLKIISREYESTLEMYKSLAVRHREAALALRMEESQKGEQFRVIEPALPSEEPIAPRRARLYAMILALALAAAATAILLREAVGRSVA